MRETDFIRQNKDKWLEFEDSLKHKRRDPEKLSELFIETTDDLSFSRTYYPNRSVRVYLNGIAQEVFQSLYKTERKKRGGFVGFWRETLPEAMWRSRKYFLMAMLVFLGSVCIGLWSAAENPEIVRYILGDRYVAMTEANIEAGDPMAVYKDEHPVTMFLHIAWNNIWVSFACFGLGILAGVGTAFMMVSNGIMVGAFIAFFIQRDLFQESFLTIMQHGTLELSMIALAGCAGFTLASGIVLPKNYNRLQSLVIAARRGIVIMLGVSAFLIVAAFIEGFVTRHTEIPDWLRVIVIILSLGIVIGYFVYYPWLRHKKGLIKDEQEDELQAERRYSIKLDQIKTNGKIFTEIFYYFKDGFSQFSKTAIVVSLLAGASLWFVVPGSLETFTYDYYSDIPWFFDIFWPWNEVNNFFQFSLAPWLFGVYILAFAALVTHALYIFQVRHGGVKSVSKFVSNQVVNCLTAAPIFFSCLLLDHVLALIAIVLVWPIMTFILIDACSQGRVWFFTLNSSLALISNSWGRLLGLFFVMIAGPWILCMFLSGSLWYWVFMFVQLNIPHTWAIADDLPWLIYGAFFFMVAALGVSLYIYGNFLFYHSLKEIKNASTLRSQIEAVGFKKRAYGLEKE